MKYVFRGFSGFLQGFTSARFAINLNLTKRKFTCTIGTRCLTIFKTGTGTRCTIGTRSLHVQLEHDWNTKFTCTIGTRCLDPDIEQRASS